MQLPPGFAADRMNATAPGTALPVEVRYTVTGEVARVATVCIRAAMPLPSHLGPVPAWVLVLFINLPVLGIALALPLSGIEVEAAGAIGLTVTVGLIAWVRWQRRKRIAETEMRKIGDTVAVRFSHDSVESRSRCQARQTPYTQVLRVRNDSLGLVVIESEREGLFIPDHAFVSRAQRDGVFAELGRRLRQK